MPLIVPIGDTADNIQTVSVEGVAYNFRFRWNNRSESWFMYLGPKGSTPVIKTRLTTGGDLLEPYRGLEGIPPGSLYMLDLREEYGRPGRDNLGISQRFQLLYMDKNIMDAVEAALDVY